MFRISLSTTETSVTKKKGVTTLSFPQEASEQLKRAVKKQGVGTYHRLLTPSSNSWLSEILYPKKGKTDWFAKSIARVASLLRFTLQRQQDFLEWDSGNTLGSQERQQRSVSILAREDDMFNKRVKEAIEPSKHIIWFEHRNRYTDYGFSSIYREILSSYSHDSHHLKCLGRLFPNILPSMSTYISRTPRSHSPPCLEILFKESFVKKCKY